MQEYSRRFPWQASVLLTALVYLAAVVGLWLVPCEMGLLVGLCQLSRIVFSALGSLVFLIFVGLAFGQHLQVRREAPAEAAGARFNRRMFYQMLFFCLLAAVFYLAVLFDRP